MMADENSKNILVDIQTRLAVVEADLNNIVDQRKTFNLWMRSFMVLIAVQLGAFLYGYGELQTKVDGLDLSEFRQSMVQFEKNVDTALVVLADHGTEIQDVRNEQARVRGNIDQIHILMDRLREKVDNQTSDRFYKRDGDRLADRIKRLEDARLNGANQ